MLHVTALEMNDDDQPPQYSLAKTLVGWVRDYARRSGVPLTGENALAGGVRSDNGWDNIHDAFDDRGCLGLTVLRIADVVDGVGADRYALFIQKYRPAGR